MRDQIQLAKEILESAGYKVEKIDESSKLKDIIDSFMSTPIEELNDELIKSAIDTYFKDYEQLPQGMDALNPEYDIVKGEFYNRYYEFAKRCRELVKSPKFNVSGYGRKDYPILRMKDKCEKVDYTFPYGWRQFARKSN